MSAVRRDQATGEGRGLKIRPSLAALIFLLSSGVPSSSRAAMVIGVGVDSCGKWTTDRAQRNSWSAAQDEQWVLGYLSAIGQSGGPEPMVIMIR